MNDGDMVEQFRAIVNDAIVPIQEKVDRIYRVLMGNGQPNEGIIAQTAMNTEFRKSYKRFKVAVFAAAAGAVISGIVSLITMFAGRFY